MFNRLIIRLPAHLFLVVLKKNKTATRKLIAHVLLVLAWRPCLLLLFLLDAFRKHNHDILYRLRHHAAHAGCVL